MITEQEYQERLTVLQRDNLDTQKRILASYMRFFRPGMPGDENVEQYTSYEICDELSDIATLQPGDVAEVLLDLGYELHISSDVTPHWLIRKAD